MITDEMLLQEICSLKEKLKNAAFVIKSYSPEYNTDDIMHDLGTVDHDQWLEEITDDALKEIQE